MKSIYDMMGRHTYPVLREDAPLEHVERFFQVCESCSLMGRRGSPSEPLTLAEPSANASEEM